MLLLHAQKHILLLFLMKKTLLLLLFISSFFVAEATHQRAGEITYKAITELKYEFTIVTYTYTPSPADRPELTINWGDGTYDIVPRTQKLNFPNNISRNVYAGAAHIFPGNGTYTISLEDPNRNYGVLNIPNSVNIPFFIQTQLVINPFLGPNNSVELLSPPIDNGCVNNLYMHNPGAYDADGDSLSYQLTACRGLFGAQIPGYLLPNQIVPGDESTFEIDPYTGTITWDKPLMQGEYNIAFLIEEWRNGVKIGHVTRDMQIEIIACDNQPPVLSELSDTCVEAGDTLVFDVSASDPNDDQVVLQALGGPLILDESPATFPIVYGLSPVQSTFTWKTTCAHVQNQPYQVVFTAKDTFNFPQLVDIATVGIKVISPAPENLSATSSGNSIHLSWEKAICEKSIGYELYRREGYFGFNPGVCEWGVPEYTGYEKIATIEGRSDTTFIDDNNNNGLEHGIDYCYIIVAFFADGSVSYASEEICMTLKKDVPIITHVSIENTDVSEGKIYVAWSKPTELDTLLMPPPYKYVILRTDDQNPGTFSRIDSTFSINDTTFTDEGLDTRNRFYKYKIFMYSGNAGNETYIGSTQTAMSMFLKIAPTDQKLILTWNVNVPWSNRRYNIFRFNEATEVFDSIGFSTQPAFSDSNLINGKNYTYFVESVGRYTASGFVNPIINHSQINAGIPVDNEPPCPPILTVSTNCQTVENTLTWINPENCPEDIEKWVIFFTPISNEVFVPLDSVTNNNTYLHSNLTSIAGCYSIIAVDSVGNRSEASNTVCVDVDSCSTYRLPNFFSPNNDEYNQLFKPYEYTSVDHVEMKIFNRWGRIVFKTTDPNINWDGKNMNNNQDCSEGAYFYVCDVFEITLKGLTKRTLTGSITLMR